MMEQVQNIRKRSFAPQPEQQFEQVAKTRRTFCASGDRPVEVWEFASTQTQHPACLVVNLHGGGFIKPRGQRDEVYCAWMAQQLKALVWDVDYALAPENPYPAALEDVQAVCRQARSEADRRGCPMLLVGHSAGGNLAAAACIADADTQQHRPDGLLIEYFPTDLMQDPVEKLTEEQRKDTGVLARAEVGRLYNQFYLQGQDPSLPTISICNADDHCLQSFPRTMMLCAGLDKLRPENKRFADRLTKQGVKTEFHCLEQSHHGFTVNRTDEWQQALQLHLQFLRSFC